ncbi:phosphorylase [Kovacikia minuta CCNUW1]|uniref:ATP adenylyltransferase family protein n=1 Tax=Kovacikia minuta TaxID=2931930 RepID=UPI001CCE3A9C|nr:phosphorylase [Kovacikia minuta]UBF26713.1 phosphorylase [Kovacikia minuta CCNUW1]
MAEKQSPSRETLLQKPGILWTRTKAQTAHALQCGALQPIPTRYEFVEQDGVSFFVRIADLALKDQDRKRQDAFAVSGKEQNPFLPYDENLFVTDISDTHVCLLNKFNVVDYHLLIITRAFEEQESLLTLPDFEAMWACLNEVEGLVFYNSGEPAGASQRHKHLQLVPFPLAPGVLKIPLEPVLETARSPNSVETIPIFPFKHALIWFASPPPESPLRSAKLTLDNYYRLLHAVDLHPPGDISPSWQPSPYNLLITREWMLMVPRSQSHFEGIPVNSLGFVGALLVRNQPQLQFLKEGGPLWILQNVAVMGEWDGEKSVELRTEN